MYSNDRLVWKSGDKILVHGEGSGSNYRQVVTLSSSNISSDGLTATVNVPSGLKPYDRSDKGYISKYYAQYPADAAPDGKLYYLHSDAFEYCVSNVAAIEKTDDAVQYEKIEPTQRIDLFDASVFACIRAIEAESRNKKARSW